MTGIEERARIVRWLREAANPMDSNSNVNRVLAYLATAIERGDHLLEEEDDDNGVSNVIFLALDKSRSGAIATGSPHLRHGGAFSE